MRMFAVMLYVLPDTSERRWSRYVAGLAEFLRVRDALFPEWKVALVLGDATEQLVELQSAAWAGVLTKALAHPAVTVHRVSQRIPSVVAKVDKAQMFPLHHRFTPLFEHPDADIVAFRDVDSPPTATDRNAIDEWRAQCPDSPALLYDLPLINCTRCGGGITVRPAAFSTARLPNPDAVTAFARTVVASDKSAWGVDEYVFDQLLKGNPRSGGVVCRAACYHHPDTMAYYTALDFRTPLIDRLPEHRSSRPQLALAEDGEGRPELDRDGAQWVTSLHRDRLHPVPLPPGAVSPSYAPVPPGSTRADIAKMFTLTE